MDTILLLVKSKGNANILANELKKEYEVAVHSSEDALEVCSTISPGLYNLVVLDIQMLELCQDEIRKAREKLQPLFLPVLLVAPRQSKATVLKHLWKTVDEIIWTPIEKVELSARVSILLRVHHYSERLREIAITDGLTRLYNRRYFMEMAEKAFKEALENELPLSVAMMDVDHFKRVNDTYGHAAGDEVLRMVAEVCRKSTRGNDILGRYGGEEFVLLMRNTPISGAVIAAERIRQAVADTSIETPSGVVKVTISIGVAQLNDRIDRLDRLLSLADEALYRAKESGRNKVVVQDETAV
jgi:two-component system cell cycle response regulator